MHDEETAPEEGTPPAEGYEPPAIESVLTAEELAREIQYGGVASMA